MCESESNAKNHSGSVCLFIAAKAAGNVSGNYIRIISAHGYDVNEAHGQMSARGIRPVCPTICILIIRMLSVRAE